MTERSLPNPFNNVMITQSTLSWEVLPPPETRLAPSVLEHPKAKSILTAFIQRATKSEIARVFEVKEKTVRAIIEAARSLSRPERI